MSGETTVLEKLRDLVRRGYATGELKPAASLFCDGEVGCAMTAAYLADVGELPEPPDDLEWEIDDDDYERLILAWAKQGLGMTDNQFEAVIHGFDGYKCVDKGENYKLFWELGQELRKEFIK